MNDGTFDPLDMQVLMMHGKPKSVRLYPNGHMGMTPTTFPTIIEWLSHEVGLG